MVIKAIETEYSGHRFRSRLEARWAVLFDEIGISWRYEYQGVTDGSHTNYLPDFYLPGYYSGGSAMWVEIKGTAPDLEEFQKATVLAFAYPSDVVVITWEYFDWETASNNLIMRHDDNGAFVSWAGCDWLQHPLKSQGWHAARSARFEHGESGCHRPGKTWPGLELGHAQYGELPY